MTTSRNSKIEVVCFAEENGFADILCCGWKDDYTLVTKLEIVFLNGDIDVQLVSQLKLTIA